MKTLTFALATVLTTATAAYAGGPKFAVDGPSLALGAGAVGFVMLNVALYLWRTRERKS